jgi:hypothetical protein
LGVHSSKRLDEDFIFTTPEMSFHACSRITTQTRCTGSLRAKMARNETLPL